MPGPIALTLLVLTATVVLAAAFFALKDEPAQANRYVNTEHGYEFTYDEGWTLAEGQTSCDPQFCNQVTELTAEGTEVYFFVNFNGGWCESTQNMQRRDIQVSGLKGEEFICPGFGIRDASGTRDAIIWHLQVPDADTNYVVIGQASPGALDGVEDIVRSFALVRTE